MKKITFFHRKVIPNFHFSVEIIFKDVRENLPEGFEYEVMTSTFFSSGLLRRLYNGIEAFFRRGKINHVTGDINYISLFLPKHNTIHTILDCVYMEQPHSRIKKMIYNYFWITMPVRRSRFVTTISEASKEEIVRYSGCEPDKVVVIPIALSSVFKKVERVYNWVKPRILLVGAAPNKNIDRILEALKGISCYVQLVGKFNPEYKAFMEKNGMDFSYEWGLNPEQMYAKYKDTDILVFASTYEGFGMPIIEAQAVGVVVVTSKIRPMTDVGGEGAAVYVDPYSVQSIRSGILSVIEDREKTDSLIRNGYLNAERFDPRSIAQMYSELYKKI